MRGQLARPKNLCLLRLSAIGDVCHAVAMVQQIQRTWPDVKITWVIGKMEHKLLGHLPGVEFIIFDKKKKFKAYHVIRQHFGKRCFDALLLMQVSLRASLLGWINQPQAKSPHETIFWRMTRKSCRSIRSFSNETRWSPPRARCAPRGTWSSTAATCSSLHFRLG